MSIDNIFDLNEIETFNDVSRVYLVGDDQFTIYYATDVEADVWIMANGKFAVYVQDVAKVRRFVAFLKEVETKNDVYAVLDGEWREHGRPRVDT